MSLLRIPGASSVAPSQLSSSDPRSPRSRSPAASERRRGRARPPPAPRPSAPATPAAVPSSDIAPGRAGRHARQRRASTTSAAPTPCRFRSRLYRCRRRPAPRRTPAGRASPDRAPSATTAAIAATPVLAIALPGPRRPPRSSAMPSSSLALEAQPRRHRRGDERDEQQRQPCQPSADEDRDADERAGHGAGRRHRPRAMAGPRDQQVERRAAAGSRRGDQGHAPGSRSGSTRATRATARAPAVAATDRLSSSRIGNRFDERGGDRRERSAPRS